MPPIFPSFLCLSLGLRMIPECYENIHQIKTFSYRQILNSVGVAVKFLALTYENMRMKSD